MRVCVSLCVRVILLVLCEIGNANKWMTLAIPLWTYLGFRRRSMFSAVTRNARRTLRQLHPHHRLLLKPRWRNDVTKPASQSRRSSSRRWLVADPSSSGKPWQPFRTTVNSWFTINIILPTITWNYTTLSRFCLSQWTLRGSVPTQARWSVLIHAVKIHR